jgi:hypothetical protein
MTERPAVGFTRAIAWSATTMCAVLVVVLAVLAYPPSAVGVVAVIVLGIAAFSYKAAWLFYFIAISCTGIAVELGGANVRLELIGLPLLTICLVHGAAMGVRAVRAVALTSALTVYLGLLFLASVTQAPDSARSLWIWIQIAASAAAFLAVLARAPNPRELVRIGTLCMGALCAFSLGALLLALVGFGGTGAGVAEDMRLIGFSIETNIFAAQVVCWLGVVWASRLRTDPLVKLSVWLMVVAVIFAGTRSAWAAAGVLLAVAAFHRLKGQRWALPAAASALMLAFAVPGLVASAAVGQPRESLIWRLANLFNTEEGTGAYRVGIYDTAWGEIANFPHWLTGKGVNSYSQIHLMDATNQGAEYLGNVFVATIYDGGVFALMALVLALTFAARLANGWRVLLLVGMVLICSAATNSIWFQFTWVYVALAVRASRDERPAERVAGGLDKVSATKEMEIHKACPPM